MDKGWVLVRDSRKLRMSYFTMGLVTLVYVIVFIRIDQGALLDATEKWSMFLLGVLGIYAGANVVQKFTSEGTTTPRSAPSPVSEPEKPSLEDETDSITVLNNNTILIERSPSESDYTEGVLNFLDFKCDTLEDEFREVKVPSETRIPSGEYVVDWNRRVTPMTKRYRSRWSWFDWHIEVKGVKNFDGIYFHPGNTDDDTSGCVLVGEKSTDGRLQGNSREVYEVFYKRVKPLLDAGERVRVVIRDV